MSSASDARMLEKLLPFSLKESAGHRWDATDPYLSMYIKLQEGASVLIPVAIVSFMLQE